MKNLSLIFFLFVLTALADVSAQNSLHSDYFKTLNTNLTHLYPDYTPIKEYCLNYERNINTIIENDRKIKIGDEEYIQNGVVQDYYNSFQSFQYETKCRFLYAWMELKPEIIIEADAQNIFSGISLLPVAISGFEKFYQNSLGGFGYWGLQYIPAVRYGLTADSCYDERLDLRKSTKAAISYLLYLHKSFGTWDYAITAYVCGAPNLRKAMLNTDDFDGAVKNLDMPEKNTFYIFLALLKWVEENEQINPAEYICKKPVVCDTVIISKRLHFEQIAGVLNIKTEDIKNLNPLFIGNVIDGRFKPKTVYLPESFKDDFIANVDSIINYKDSIYFPKYKPIKVVTDNSYYESNDTYVSVSPGEGYDEIKYKIVSGDNLGSIAEKYGVKVQDLKNWNNISGTNIYAGQQISIWVLKGSPQVVINNQSQQNTNNSNSVVKIPDKVKVIYDLKNYTLVETYTVKSGDSPYKIAKNYSWTNADEIMAWNNISDPSKLQIGQKLKIYKKK